MCKIAPSSERRRNVGRKRENFNQIDRYSPHAKIKRKIQNLWSLFETNGEDKPLFFFFVDIIWFLVFLFLGTVNGQTLWASNIEETPFERSLKSLLNQMILQMPSCIVLVYSSSTQPFLLLPPDVVAIKVRIDSTNLKQALLASYTMKCNGYITDGESAEDMLTALGEARLEARERHTPRVVILPSRDDIYNTSCRFFEHPEAAYIPDMIVISLTENSLLPAVLILLSSSNSNDSGEQCIIYAKWPSEIEDFFPDKIKDMGGKALRVATLEYPPYTLLAPSFDGMEARVINEFCRKYNCTISIITDDDLWGEIFGNGTGIGLSGNVYMDLADFGVGAVYAWEEEYKYVDYSYPYLNTKVTVLVPKPDQLPEWRIPLLPFSTTMWAIQLFSVFGAAAVMYAVNKAASNITLNGTDSTLGGEFSSFGGTTLRAMAMALLQPPPNRLPASSPLRRFFTVFEVLFLFFTTIYSGALSSVLTVPLYYPPIDTPLKLYEAGIPWVADHDAWTYSLKGATEPHIKGLVQRFEAHDTKKLIELANKGGYGFSIEIMAAGHVTQTKHLSGEMILGLHVMKTELYSTSLVFLLRKGSPYSEKLNNLLGKCLDSGLLLLWETDVTLNYLSSRLQTALKISEGSRVEVHDPTQLRLVHVQGVFIMLAIGLSVSFLVFIFELFKFSRKTLKQ